MDTSWRDKAACKGQDPNEWIGPASGGTRITNHNAICRTCPVAARCLDAALTKPRWSLGIWAGTSVTERSAMAKAMRLVIAEGSDVRSAAAFSPFANDPGIVSDIAVAIESPVHLAAILAARVELPVVVAAALVARHDEAIAETIASRSDMPKWLTDMASRIAGPMHGETKRVANVARMRRIRARRYGVAA